MSRARQNHRTPPPDRATSAKIAALFVVGAGLVLLMLSELPIWGSLGLIGLTAAVVVRRSGVYVGLVPVLVLGCKLAFVWQYRFAIEDLNAADVLQATSLIGYLAFSFRYIELDADRFQWPKSSDKPVPAIRLKTPAFLRAVTASIVPLAVAVAVACVWLVVAPLEAFWPNRDRFDPIVLRAILVVWSLVIVAMLPMGVFSILSWRKLWPNQAVVYLHRCANEEVRREQRSIERRRRVTKRKRKLTAE